MSLINVSNLTFAYDGSYDNIFENVSFSIDTDWRLGFTGRNGRGKTTFLNLLLGRYEYTGTIASSVEFCYFPYDVQDEWEQTLDILERLCPQAEQWQIMRELNLLRVDADVLYRPFATLSNGERTKILLAALFLGENRFLLIDEPTNHLDMQAREAVADYLCSKKGFILVSHDRWFLDKCVDHILSINKTNIEVQWGNFSSWLANKEAQDNYELAENERLRKDIRRLKEAARRTAEWSDRAEASKIGFDPRRTEKSMNRRPYEAAKAKRLMSASTAIQRRQQAAIEEKSGLLRNIEEAESLKLHPLEHHSRVLARADGVELFYGSHTVCRDVGFTLERGDRLALCGPNGSGKSSIIRLLCGMEIGYSGVFERASNLKISLVPQDASFLSGSLEQYAAECGVDLTLFLAILRKLDFSRTQFEKDMSDYSAGQKKKVLIARSLSEQAHLYVWDEPLNYIDVLSRMQIERLILEFSPTLVFVEHDRGFADKISTGQLVLGGQP